MFSGILLLERIFYCQKLTVDIGMECKLLLGHRLSDSFYTGGYISSDANGISDTEAKLWSNSEKSINKIRFPFNCSSP